MYAELSLDHQILKEVGEKVVKADEQRELVDGVRVAYPISERRACRLIGVSRSVYRYTAKRVADVVMVNTLLEVANAQPRWAVTSCTIGCATRSSMEP